ncbi:MAG: ABC transporter permease [bacterium]|nr:ABC transporter permease [bacterium]
MIADIVTVFTAEFLRRVKSRAFMIGIVIGTLGIIFITKMPALLDKAFNGPNEIVLVGDRALLDRAAPLLAKSYTIEAELPPQAIDEATLRAHHASSAFVFTQHARSFSLEVYAHDPGAVEVPRINRMLMPLALQDALHADAARVKQLTTVPIAIKSLSSKFANSADANAARGIAYTLLFFLYMLILINSQLVMGSVAEEKTSRIAELLIASVDPSALLAGKILAGTVLAVLQMVIWIGVGTAFGSPAGGAAANASSDNIFSLAGILNVITPGVVIAFLAFFVIGLLQVSTIFAAFASLINRTEDLGSVTGPLLIPVVGAFFIAIAALGSPDAPFAVVASFVPLIAPFVMFSRIAVSNVPLWQFAGSLAINLAALYAIAIGAGKIYRVGMLLYGRAPKLSQVWAVLRS